MNRTFYIILGIGLVVLLVTFLGFNIVYKQMLPSQEEILGVGSISDQQLANFGVYALIEKTQEAENIKKAMVPMLVIELLIIAAVLFVFSQRKPAITKDESAAPPSTPG
jgi:hypothetical protein